MSPELEDLDALLRHPGWGRFVAYVTQEWGSDEGGGLRFKQGAKKAANNTEDAMALSHLRQIMAAQSEIHRLIAWAGERVAHLKATEPGPDSDGVPLSRRGGL
jgi:hypothetical protein